MFDLWPDQFEHLNDDRVGRCLDRVAQSLDSNLIMDVVTHVVQEFDLDLSELHNDSTTISVFGDYSAAAEEQSLGVQAIPAITWGHSKGHRPDLKQLLYILTVSDDGGEPIYFQADSGNTDDGKLRDVFRVCTEKQCGEQLSKEGYRVLWFHRWGNASTRIRRLQRAIRELTDLRQRLGSPRTRFRNRAKVNKAVDEILNKHRVGELLHVSIDNSSGARRI